MYLVLVDPVASGTVTFAVYAVPVSFTALVNGLLGRLAQVGGLCEALACLESASPPHVQAPHPPSTTDRRAVPLRTTIINRIIIRIVIIIAIILVISLKGQRRRCQ